MPLVALRLVVLLLAGLWPSAAEPYVQQTYMGTPLAWADPEVTLTLGLLCIPGPDPCYHAEVVAAAADWNAVGARFTFHTTSYLADPCAHGDRRNTVSFSSTQCGMDFPPDVLAVTITSFFPQVKSLRLMLCLISARMLTFLGLPMRVHGAPPSLISLGSRCMNSGMSSASTTRTSMGRSCRPL